MASSAKAIISLMGATATGKTEVAMALSQVLPVSVISVDSALVYRGMDIGTAKPTREALSSTPHQLIDIINPDDDFSVADFVSAARQAIRQAQADNQIALLVGGSMFYFHALLQGIDDMPAANLDIRQQLKLEAQQKGWPFMHRQLNSIDSISAAKIHPNHSQRILRALEIFYSSGKPLSQWQQNNSQGLLQQQHCINFALSVANRDYLHQRIGQRFYNMIEQGFEREVIDLIQRFPSHSQLNAFKIVGYRQMIEYINNDINYNKMLEKGLSATRQLAKRQMTWLRQWQSPICWLDMNAKTEARDVAEYIANIIK